MTGNTYEMAGHFVWEDALIPRDLMDRWMRLEAK